MQSNVYVICARSQIRLELMLNLTNDHLTVLLHAHLHRIAFV